MSTTVRTYLTIRQLALKHKAFSEGSLRWLWFNGEKNGFASCVRKVGKKVLISEEDFLTWIESGSAGK